MEEEKIDQPIFQTNLPSSFLSMDAARWLESIEHELMLFEHDLKNERLVIYQNEDGSHIQVWEKIPNTQPMLNENGVQFIISSLRMVATKNTFLGNLEEKRIMQICMLNSMTISTKLYTNMKKFGIDSVHTCDYLVDRINDFMEMAFRRALRGEEKKGIFQIHKIVENLSNQRKDEGKESIFSLTRE